MAAQALKLLDVVDDGQRERSRGDPELTREAVAGWKAGQRRCRGRGPKGAQRVDEDIHDELVAADILSRKVIEVPDDDTTGE